VKGWLSIAAVLLQLMFEIACPIEFGRQRVAIVVLERELPEVCISFFRSTSEKTKYRRNELANRGIIGAATPPTHAYACQTDLRSAVK